MCIYNQVNQWKLRFQPIFDETIMWSRQVYQTTRTRTYIYLSILRNFYNNLSSFTFSDAYSGKWIRFDYSLFNYLLHKIGNTAKKWFFKFTIKCTRTTFRKRECPFHLIFFLWNLCFFSWWVVSVSLKWETFHHFWHLITIDTPPKCCWIMNFLLILNIKKYFTIFLSSFQTF